ncbi:glycosyltransferase 87 family protein [Myxococcus stipitatus]|uniref:glycosyltransferase 87 family protein n=1 Tax=Myxococcus stipitatus TaxID=83455 RepID=UPI0030CABE84
MSPLVAYAFSPRVGDMDLYFRSARALLAGATPNQDFRFEYPPYALLWFVPAAWLRDTEPGFVRLFGLQLVLMDGFIKWLLLREGVRAWGHAWRSMVPCIAYSVTTWAASLYYLKRYDLIPAALTLAALMALAHRRDVLAGLALSVGVVTKLYPVVLVPVMVVVCWRRRALGKLTLGLSLGVAPLVLLSTVWPWWGFMSFHMNRGLQVESLAASLIWAAHHLGWVRSVVWLKAPAAYELHGDVAESAKGLMRWLWVVGTLGMTALGAWAARHRPSERVGDLARLALGPLLAFIILNPVLSPQFLTWLMGAAALSLLSGSATVPVLILAAAVMSRGTFVGPGYRVGCGVAQTLLLLARNGLLLTAGFLMLREMWRARPPRTEEDGLVPEPGVSALPPLPVARSS